MTQYSEKSYKMASDNTKYNAAGKAVIRSNNLHGIWIDPKISKPCKEDFKDTKILKIRTCSAESYAYHVNGNDMGI